MTLSISSAEDKLREVQWQLDHRVDLADIAQTLRDADAFLVGVPAADAAPVAARIAQVRWQLIAAGTTRHTHLVALLAALALSTGSR